MIVPVMAISNLVLTQQIYSEETNGAHVHYREPVPLKKWSQSQRLDITAAYSKGDRLQQPKTSTKCTQTTPHADHRVIASLTSYSALLLALASGCSTIS